MLNAVPAEHQISQSKALMTDSKVAVIAGYGVGISAAAAKRFGQEGYKLALLARTQSRLDQAVAEFAKQGITAKGYATDLSNAAAVKSAVAAVHADFGAITVLLWNAFSTRSGLNALLSAATEEYQNGFDISVTGLVAAVQAAHDHLKASQGAILVTGGGLALENDNFAQFAINYNAASLAVAKAAQRKLVHVMHKGLQADGIYVAEVTVCGMVKGTMADPEGKSSLTPEAVAEKFWELVQQRDSTVWFVTVQ